MSEIKGHQVEQVESRFGVSVHDLLMDTNERELTQADAAAELGISYWTLRYWLKKLGIKWHNDRGATSEALRAISHKWATVFVEYQGDRVHLAELARRSGLPWSTIQSRWHRGVRGDALTAPRRWCNKAPKIYELGYTTRDWSVITAYARERSPKDAANKFKVPYGAVKAVLRGEWERVD